MNAIDTQLVTVTVDAIVAGVPAGSPSTVACLMSLGDYKQSRNTTKYECMSSNDSSVGLGAIVRDPLTFELLYNEEATDGQQKLKTAFENNSQLVVAIEFDNEITPTTGNGTTITANMGVQEYNMSMPKDGKVGATFTLEFMEGATITEAA